MSSASELRYRLTYLCRNLSVLSLKMLRCSNIITVSPPRPPRPFLGPVDCAWSRQGAADPRQEHRAVEDGK
ncbi:hypothetical protein RRG08_052891 [Elysia crispata]|uniref:Uncharacterized protein n=1 Tax=Elysia crispata TaxID=231223 RepID=A0AAE0ZEB7_9GAST|nr:hypothetical protein RRG08_052891 [Elysia crispata]